MAAYIKQDAYDLIIVDCQLYEPNTDERTIAQIQKNMKELDKCINIAYTQIMEKNYRLIVSSLYGIRATFRLTQTMELVDLSNKTPFLLIDKEIRNVDMVFKANGSFIDIARIIAISFGCKMKNNLVIIDSQDSSGGSSKQKLFIVILVAFIALLFVVFYLKSQGLLG